MKDKLKIVVDEQHHTHIIDEKIGEGGQGTVYRTKDADIAIKIAIDDNTNKKLFDKNKYDKKLNYLSHSPQIDSFSAIQSLATSIVSIPSISLL